MQIRSPTNAESPPSRIRSVAGRLRADTRGETAIEYGLIASLIVLALIAALPMFVNASGKMYNKISNAMVNSSP